MTSLRYGFLIGFGLPLTILAIVIVVMAVRWLLRHRVIPPAAGAAGVYNIYIAWAFTKKTLWVLLALVVIGALLWGLAVYNWSPTALGQRIISIEWRDVPVVIFVGALAVLGFSAYKTDKKDLAAMLLMTFIIITTFVAYELYRHDAIGAGARIWVVYAVCIGLGLMTKNLADDPQRVARALLALCFIFAGFYQIGWTWEWFHERITSWDEGPTKQVVVAPPPVAVHTPPLGVSLTATLGPTPVELNPGGTYKLVWDEVDPSQCIEVYASNGRDLGNDCERDLNIANVYGAKFASARGDRVPITYVLSRGP